MMKYKQKNMVEWLAKRMDTRDKDLCPCDSHPPDQCETCRGACSCHWEEDSDGRV